MDTTSEKVQTDHKQTITERRVIFSVKEIIGALGFLSVVAASWMNWQIQFKDMENNQRALELRMDQYEKNSLNNSLKFDKIDAKLDGIQSDVTDVKMRVQRQEDKNATK